MSSRKNRNKRNEKPDLYKNLADLSLEQIDNLSKSIPIALQSKLQELSTSDDFEDIMKANLYLDSISKKQDGKVKAILFNPNEISDTGRGFKDPQYYGSLSFDTLRRMGDIFIVRSVVNTRVEQVQNFLHFSLDEQKEGYTIRKKRSFFERETKSEPTREDEKKIEYIRNFLEKGGVNEKWDSFDTFQDFGRKIVLDSLTLDQLSFEIIRDRSWNLAKFRAIDASLVRLLNSVDPRFRYEYEKYKVNGYLPKYCMVWQNQIVENPVTKEKVIFYPWELGYGIRNKSTNIYKNGYGTSELETLMEIITWILWGMQYNGNFFSKGSQPKGFINVKNANISNPVLNEFRQAWTQTMRGVENCLHGDSFVITDKGGITLSQLLSNKDEVFFSIWTGQEFEKARVYKTGLKILNKMCLNNGMFVLSSPDHRFKVVSDSGEIEWKKRSEIKLGDFVLVDNSNDKNKEKTIPQTLAVSIMKSVREHMKKHDASIVKNLYIGKDPISKQQLFEFIERNAPDYKIDKEVVDFSFEEVIALEEYDEKVEMFDVEVFNEKHQFIVNGMLSHNSHRVPIINGIDLEWIDLQKCLHPESNVVTRNGVESLGSLLGNEKEIFSEIWDGRQFTKARIYKTQRKKIFGLELKNRLKIKTSDNHKFLILRNNTFEWVERKDLVRDDYVLVNKNIVTNDSCKSLFYKDKEVESDLFDLIGWIIGDGYIDTGNKSRKTIHTFYHPTKEDDIIEYHLSLCKKYGINAKKYIQYFNEEQLEKKRNRGHFKILSSYQIRIVICDHQFYDWFRSLGFNNSKQKKNVASFLYSTKSEYRCAFLRGWFSADGHCNYQSGYRIDLACANHKLQQQCRELLICEGIQCTSFEEKLNLKGLSKNRKDSILIIKNKDLFIERIGFLQQYKNNSFPEKKKSWYIKDDASKEYIMYLATELRLYYRTLSKEKQCLSWLERHDIQNIGKGYQKASLSKVLYYAEKIGYQLPRELSDFNLIQIKNLWEEDEFIDMVDVEMYNEEHQFIANGILVHNCNRDMEFNDWLKFLFIITCSVYRIDPTELGFQFKDQAQIFGQDGQRERLSHSKEKGLKPLLIFLQNIINHYLISEMFDGEYEFIFTGIEVEDESRQVELDKKKLEGGMVSMEDIFRKYSNREFDPKKDTILNSVYQNAQQVKQQQAMFGGDTVDGEEGVEKEQENPFDQYEKSMDNNPILSTALKYIENNWGEK